MVGIWVSRCPWSGTDDIWIQMRRYEKESNNKVHINKWTRMKREWGGVRLWANWEFVERVFNKWRNLSEGREWGGQDGGKSGVYPLDSTAAHQSHVDLALPAISHLAFHHSSLPPLHSHIKRLTSELVWYDVSGKQLVMSALRGEEREEKERSESESWLQSSKTPSGCIHASGENTINTDHNTHLSPPL